MIVVIRQKNVGLGEHRRGELGLGREDEFVGDMDQGAAFVVFGPVPGQVEGPVDDRVALRGGVGEVDGDLA
ncbi:hypothetical protein AOB60_36925 [Streptomyces noursei]|uniref:Uncharacterized protein n=1 Tax=Streptomyces noursei TaxID=1971 RepID=A0A2N8P7C0_STRNR|nr:hypothetical protein AOB60_36925 [Streptomyces noursei]